ncbi:hypothetical protein [Alkalicoccus daliensis]|uniref:Uncharacterized protein n=1 Tax=Alkalicoccus daliensis TaxID=745820 RepID=A0A1H0CZR2_9BACI|nr:hypothetical protein [Alkalicoccus daliensis]SDN63276.1 hypothetical protein SAMN04488053_102287 [Alkalicoccus daliensis]
MKSLLELFGTNYFTHIIGILSLGTFPFLVGYFILYKKFNLSEEWSTLIPGSVCGLLLFWMTVTYLDDPPYVLFGFFALLMVFILFKLRRKKAAQ